MNPWTTIAIGIGTGLVVFAALWGLSWYRRAKDRRSLRHSQLQQSAQQFLTLLGAVVVAEGKNKRSGREYRISKATISKVDHSIDINTLKSGTVVIRIKEKPA